MTTVSYQLHTVSFFDPSNKRCTWLYSPGREIVSPQDKVYQDQVATAFLVAGSTLTFWIHPYSLHPLACIQASFKALGAHIINLRLIPMNTWSCFICLPVGLQCSLYYHYVCTWRGTCTSMELKMWSVKYIVCIR